MPRKVSKRSPNDVGGPGRAASLIISWEERLHSETWLLGQSYGVYKACSDAIRGLSDRSHPVVLLADRTSFQAAIAVMMRLSALLDRDADGLSIGLASSWLRHPDVNSAVCSQVATDDLGNLRPALQRITALRVKSFFQVADAIDVGAIRILTHYRNLGIAHIEERQVTKFLKRQALEGLVISTCEMQQRLSMLIAGKRTHVMDRALDYAAYETGIWRRLFEIEGIKQYGQP
jgi:hypothetical protein